MVMLSVNVNKVATVRNARGGSEPSVVEAARVCLRAGAKGITVHPRVDRRHITPDDVRALHALLSPLRGTVEYNLEGDPRPDFLELVREIKPDQCTLVPVTPGEITSHAGWSESSLGGTSGAAGIAATVKSLRDAGIRVALFVEPSMEPIRFAASIGAHRVELYTEPFARAFASGERWGEASFATYCEAAEIAHQLGLGINAGHDLDLNNLVMFHRLPHLAEVSIGHALVSRALFVGLEAVVREYVTVLSDTARNDTHDTPDTHDTH
ncbi:MAG: pyridoxine 5'-phosphate synthase [Polyangiales bacterium]